MQLADAGESVLDHIVTVAFAARQREAPGRALAVLRIGAVAACRFKDEAVLLHSVQLSSALLSAMRSDDSTTPSAEATLVSAPAASRVERVTEATHLRRTVCAEPAGALLNRQTSYPIDR